MTRKRFFCFWKNVFGVVSLMLYLLHASLVGGAESVDQHEDTEGQPLEELADSWGGVTLGPPPKLALGKEVTSVELMSINSELAVSAVISPANRQESFDFFWSDYEVTSAPPISWTGTYSPCNPGTTSQEFKDATIKRINYFRAMAGVPANITLSSTLSIKDQDAALMFSVNNAISHNPPSSWTCYTANGYLAAGASNVVLGLNG